MAGLPCREQYGYIWIWWDPKGQSAPDDLPALPAVGPIPESDDSGWRSLEGTVVWQAHWLRVLEAFMDLTHAPFVHSGSFGAMAPDQLMPVEQWCRDDSVYERVIAPRDRHYRADQGRGLRAWFNQADDKDPLIRSPMMLVNSTSSSGWPMCRWCGLFLVIFRFR